tara:strand:+ start:463 stop:783 length:321 start_codon:yes stop_codon:yes gene_type:complete
MKYTHKNIIGTEGLNQLLLDKQTDVRTNKLINMYITNVEEKINCIFDLVIVNKVDKYYLLKNLSIPVGAVLKLDEEDLTYDYREYDLYITLKPRTSKLDIKLTTLL